MKPILLILFFALAVIQIIVAIPFFSRFIIELVAHIGMTVSGLGGLFDWDYVIGRRG